MKFESINETLRLIKSKKISVKELSTFFIEKINKNKNLNAFIYLDEKLILDQAEKLDNIKENLPLKGIPLGIKDLFCTKNMPTTAGSKILSNFKPTYESFVTNKLLNSGALFLGKTNLDEFAMGSSTTTSFFGNTINPVSPK